MSLSGLFGVLRICGLDLVKMSLNCNSSVSNGELPNNLESKKTKEALHGSNRRGQLLFLWLLGVVIVFIYLFSGLSYGVLKRRAETPCNTCGDKAGTFLEHFNVSKGKFHALGSLFSESDQITSLKCTKESGLEMPPNDVISCALMVRSDKHQFEKHHKMVSEILEPQDQCPVRDGSIHMKADLSMGVYKSLSPDLKSLSSSTSSNHQHCEEHLLQTTPLGDIKKHCDICFVKVCSLVLLGLALSFSALCLVISFWRNRNQSQQQAHDSSSAVSTSSAASPWSWRVWLLYMFVGAGLVGSIWLYMYLNKDIVLRREETLTSMCDERARMLQDQFNVSMNHVHALAILVSTFYHGKQPSAIDQKTFGEYTERTSFERPLTSGVSYALRVLHCDREQFEKQHGWIKKMETEDQTLVQDFSPEHLEPSPIHDEYAPVIFSQQTVAHIVSIDMMSGKEDRENILRARASGKGVLTSPFKLLKSNHLGVVLTFAVYNVHLPPDAMPEQRINATVGYLRASYDGSLVEKLLHQLASKQKIVVNVYDTTNKSSPIQMCGSKAIDTGHLKISNLDFGDPARKHEMHCSFKQKPPPPWTAIIASVGVAVITMLLGHIFHAAINQIAKVERDCVKMEKLKLRAEAADVAKSQFLATVSHEIRTPMNGVLGMLQMLMDTDLDANQLDYAQTAHDSGKDLISLINELLDQAKIESGRLELEAVPFDLRAVLDNVLSLFSGKSHEKGVELAVYVSDHVPQVVIGDPSRIRQIITNLVGNSIKFTHDKGHIFVSVHLADEVRDPLDIREEVLKQSLTLVQEASERSYNTLSGFPVVDRWKSWDKFTGYEETEKIKLLVTVEDTGVGIPVEAQARIFMPFMQADSSTSRTYGGTGIGLSICKRLVDLMGGEIGFMSEPGTGSTFSFTAAFGKGETSSLDTNWQLYDPALSGLQGFRALVVDDKSIRAEVTRYHLKRLGISMNRASSLDSACSYLSSVASTSSSPQPAMVLVDKDIWNKESALALSQTLKPNGCTKAQETTGVKIFLLETTTISSADRNELKSTGLVDDVLTKPLRSSLLISSFQESFGIGKNRQFNRRKPLPDQNFLKEKRILVVDDNRTNRRVAEASLKKYGATVTCVESGKDALAKLTPPHNFDACFMDLQMPEMDGFEATRRIRSLESIFNGNVEPGDESVETSPNMAHWHTPILAMTADVIQTNEACIKCGMDGYVAKPFEGDQLYSAVARFFESG